MPTVMPTTVTSQEAKLQTFAESHHTDRPAFSRITSDYYFSFSLQESEFLFFYYLLRFVHQEG
jgi:hypothetical protein